MSRAVALALVLVVACGGATTPEPDPLVAIERIRQRARDNPRDPEAWRALAEWEPLGEGGDADEARGAVAHALELAPDDPVLRFLSALEHDQRGRPRQALDGYLAAIDAARGSADALGPAVAEAATSLLGALEEEVPGFGGRVAPVLERVAREPGRLGLPARDAATAWLIAHARRRGDLDAADRFAAELGCLREARLAGPFGPWSLLGFDETLAAEGRGPLADAYDLGPNRGRQPTRTIEATGCVLRFDGGALSTSGSWVAEGTLRVDAPGPHLLAVDTPNAVQVRVDGELVASTDRRRRLGPRYGWHAVELDRGEHELEVKIASRHPRPVLFVTLDRPRGDYDPTRGVSLPEPDSPAARALAALVARSRGDRVGMRELLLDVEPPGASAAMLVLRARAALGDPFLPSSRRGDEARRLLEHARRRDPRAWFPALRLAWMEQGALEKVARMREVARTWPELVEVQLDLAGMLDDHGFTEDAQAAVARARELNPESCAALRSWYGVLRGRMRYDAAHALVDDLVACDAASTARLDMRSTPPRR